MGRVGPTQWQDWYRGCVKAVALERKLVECGQQVVIVIVNAVHTTGYQRESDYAAEALRGLGARNILVELKSHETIGELEAVCEIAKQEKAELIIISTFAHYLRVAWLLRGIPAEHYIAFGLPRWREMVTDAILTVLFPLLDLLGGRKRFLEMVNRRRLNGKKH